MVENNKYTEEIFHFAGKWEMPSICGLLIRKEDDQTFVILTELYGENPGSSVTEMIRKLAAEIGREYHIDPKKAVFIVHNPERYSKYEFFAENFYRANMNWNGQEFNSLNWEKLEDFSLPMS